MILATVLLTATAAFAAAPAQAIAPAATKRLTATFTLQSVDSVQQVAGSHQYGVNILEGTTTIKGSRVQVQRMSVTQYVDGSGPISGFLTLTWPDGSRIGMSVTGQSQQTAKATNVYGTMQVIAATGTWKGYGGVGALVGTRRGAIGSPVSYEMTLALVRG
jgi:hypothetical protein